MAFAEAARPEFRHYAAQVVANAAALAAALAGHGFRLVSGGTDNHMLLVDLRPFDPELTGKEAQEVLDRAGITCNRNTIPDDPRSPFLTSGLRLGTAAETTAGMGPAEMQVVADLIVRTLKARTDEAELDGGALRGRRAVRRLPAVSRSPGLARARHRLVRPGPGDRRGRHGRTDRPGEAHRLRVGYVAHPGERTVHTKPIPYGGGAAMFMGFLVAVLGAAAIPQLRPIFQDSPEMTGVVLAAGAMFAVGLIDDVRDMSAPAKMAGQVLAASILYFSGVTMYELKIPLAGFFVLTPGIVPLITAVWVIALTNAVNLIDGLDGLAAGVVAIGGRRARDLRHAPHGPRPPAERQHRPAGGRRSPAASASASCPSTSTRPASSWVTPARTSSACSWPPRRWSSAAASPPRCPSAASPTSSSPPCSSRSSFSACPWSTWRSPSCGARRGARGFDTPDKEHIHHRLLRLGHGPAAQRHHPVGLDGDPVELPLFPLFVHQVNAFIPIGAAALGVGLYTFFHPGLRRGNGEDEDR